MNHSAEILAELKNISTLLTSNQTDYCDTGEASRIMAVPERQLKVLHERYGLPRYKRVKHFVYKKVDCYRYAGLLDAQTILL